ncbi:unnamed protein product [marine sediment metagenome]|uniref:Uncharacterized protein n=1 Tax=marine sediment metagenome TaxID=412755 RepID=X1BT47_9ZZZZ
MRDTLSIFLLAMVLLWCTCLTIQDINLREKIIALETDNATHGIMIRSNRNYNTGYRLQAVERNIATLQRDNYKEYKLTGRQKEALDKRFGLDLGDNRRR